MKKNSAQAGIQTENFDAVMTVYTVFHKNVFCRLKSTGLTVGQPKVLDFLAYGGTIIQKDIARACEIEPSTAARLLNKMEASGLIRRARLEENRRAVTVALTARGAEQAKQVQKAFRDCEKDAFVGFADDRTEQFMDTLNRMEENLRNSADMAARPFPENLETFRRSFHEQLRSCQSLLYKQLFRFLKDTGLTPGQPKILEFLKKREGCQQREIAAACRIEPATVTSLLLHMEKADLIQRKGEEADRRALHVYLTEKGRKNMERTMRALEQTVTAGFAGIEEQQESFRKDLLLIRGNLEERSIYD